ncbi:hypothetical protein DICPUDRAFT_152437 [Dictyostelium purpureum]|uniref:Homologous-pairing protein 2 homolog n=1 Tax=Dictyostelium purpureum TaxID=5786 RepID=F0ZLC9_DICPU|nr:uncharacterized protein DICPUDRAFT_152437 [Dictyostelium purpureum]EGC35235.1 hypothetical protein DICPUDRAFT_152437 [Dictyostelium purpureum]|eukprot:XP_003288222.1 hypothetical protein DICPUDRAFT_152437 [Dictyostelium purpureum]
MSKKYSKKEERNRPYNYQMIEAQFPSMGKTQVQKTLKSLHEQNRIAGKEYNKSVIYWKIQDTGPKLDEQGYEIPQETMDDLNRKVDSLTRQLEQEKDTLKSLLSTTKQLNSQLSDQQIQDEVQQLESENSQLEKKLKDFKSKTSMMSDADKQRLQDTVRKARNEWIKRKRIFKECLDQILERSSKKRKDLQNEIGWETDEDLKITMIEDHSKPQQQQPVSYKKQRI